MAVTEYKRQVSKVQFLETARELEIFTFKHCAKFPKRYSATLTNNIVNLSISILNELKSANSIYPTNQSEVQLRQDCFIRANCNLQALISQLDIARDLFMDTTSVNTWCEWMRLVDEEAKLISAIKKTDKERYKNFLN